MWLRVAVVSALSVNQQYGATRKKNENPASADEEAPENAKIASVEHEDAEEKMD